MKNSRQKLLQKEFDVSGLSKLQEAAQFLSNYMSPRTVVLLNGDLGAGKTQLAKYLVETLGGEFPTSPSFSIENIYETKAFTIHHFDLYRLESEDDIESSGFWDAFESESLILIEWASRLHQPQFSKNWQVCEIKIENSNHERKLNCVVYAAEA